MSLHKLRPQLLQRRPLYAVNWRQGAITSPCIVTSDATPLLAKYILYPQVAEVAEFAVVVGVDEGVEAFVWADSIICGNREIWPIVVVSAWNDAFTTDLFD